MLILLFALIYFILFLLFLLITFADEKQDERLARRETFFIMLPSISSTDASLQRQCANKCCEVQMLEGEIAGEDGETGVCRRRLELIKFFVKRECESGCQLCNSRST